MTTIILNAEGVNALFPEGTEARVELQRTVLRKLAEQYIKQPGELDSLKSRLSDAMRIETEQILKGAGFIPGTWGGLSLNEAARESLRKETISLITTTVRNHVDAADVDGKIKEVVDTTFDYRVREAVKKRLSEVQASLT